VLGSGMNAVRYLLVGQGVSPVFATSGLTDCSPLNTDGYIDIGDVCRGYVCVCVFVCVCVCVCVCIGDIVQGQVPCSVSTPRPYILTQCAREGKRRA
jgi:hypothetical protein